MNIGERLDDQEKRIEALEEKLKPKLKVKA